MCFCVKPCIMQQYGPFVLWFLNGFGQGGALAQDHRARVQRCRCAYSSGSHPPRQWLVKSVFFYIKPLLLPSWASPTPKALANLTTYASPCLFLPGEVQFSPISGELHHALFIYCHSSHILQMSPLTSPQSTPFEDSIYFLQGHWENLHLGKGLPHWSTFVDCH